MNENEKILKKILSNLLKIDINEITNQTSSKDIESWDSFNTLNIVVEVENEFGIVINLEELVTLKTFLDLKNILRSKNIEFK
jgi:acyl carrier protein